MLVSKYFVYFMIFSVMGWIYECAFCTIKKGKWENRGFLYGPLVPIYGFGAVGITMVSDALTGLWNVEYRWWQIFLISFFGSIVLEYGTSWMLEKLFHAYWWDYSDMPLNLHGRVCFPYSVGFGCAGLLVVYVILPFVQMITGWIPPLLMEIFGLLFMALLSIDATLTVSALTHFERTVETVEAAWNEYMDQFVKNMQESKHAAEARWDESRQAAAMRIAQERERFSKERLEQGFASMGLSTKSALRRVQGFRRTKRVESGRLDLALRQLKERVARRK